MDKEYVYDTDEVQRLMSEYSDADSNSEKERIEASLGELLTSTVDAHDPDFPSEGELLSKLTELHREMQDEDVLGLIEEEIASIGFGLSVKIPTEDPMPGATTEELIEQLDAVNSPETTRYLRLRIFESIDRWDDLGDVHDEETDDAFWALSDDDLEYLHSKVDGAASWFIESELTKRTG